MKKISIIILILIVSFFIRTACFAAADSLSSGIHFEKGLSWKQILAKAKLEKKYIFVDCYATWCGPCKKMDKEIYPLKEVGDYFNDKFISVKVQMDTAANDKAETRAFYADARYIRTLYKVSYYPTLLFFNSDGNLLNEEKGFMDTTALVKFTEDVTSPQKDYYNLLKEYNEGSRNLNEMAFLARTADGLLADHAQAKAIAGQYMRLLKKENWFTEENIKFFEHFTSKSGEPGFAFFHKNAAKINEVMRSEDYSQGVIQHILYEEFVVPEIPNKTSSENSPDWKMIASKIARKYGRYYAERVTIGARTDWAAAIKNWPEHTKYFISYIEKYGPKTDDGGQWEAFALNNDAWEIFEHSTDNAELNIALKWSLRAVTIDPTGDWMDTYANILYKLKKRDRALKWEGIAAELTNHKETAIEATLTKMKEGVPTWGAN